MNPDPATIEEINQLLRQAIGLNPESLGKHLVMDAIKRRMESTGIQTGEKYSLRARVAPEELAMLIDEVIVPESWFFRDVSPFECLLKFAAAWRLKNPGRKFRALSIPCCTGEEAYSMALVLIDKGFDPGLLEVVGVDISENLLEKARLGVFGANSFREKTLKLEILRDKYFHKTGKDWVLHPSLVKLVRFQQGNLADPAFLAGELPFDVIFCRNVVIYMDEHHRKAGLKRLSQLLDENGILYVGHTETRLASQNHFYNWNEAYPASFNKTQSKSPAEIPGGKPASKKQGAPSNQKPSASTELESQKPTKPLVAPVSSKSKSRNLLAMAQNAADKGKLREALEICQQLLNSRSPKAAVYSLVGTIHMGLEETELAEAAFNKALYLDPDHEETLAGLLAISRKQGDHQKAENFARRLKQLQEGRPSP